MRVRSITNARPLFMRTREAISRRTWLVAALLAIALVVTVVPFAPRSAEALTSYQLTLTRGRVSMDGSPTHVIPTGTETCAATELLSSAQGVLAAVPWTCFDGFVTQTQGNATDEGLENPPPIYVNAAPVTLNIGGTARPVTLPGNLGTVTYQCISNDCGDGVFVLRSSTSSMPCISPMPRTSPMTGYLSFRASR